MRNDRMFYSCVFLSVSVCANAKKKCEMTTKHSRCTSMFVHFTWTVKVCHVSSSCVPLFFFLLCCRLVCVCNCVYVCVFVFVCTCVCLCVFVWGGGGLFQEMFHSQIGFQGNRVACCLISRSCNPTGRAIGEREEMCTFSVLCVFLCFSSNRSEDHWCSFPPPFLPSPPLPFPPLLSSVCRCAEEEDCFPSHSK